MSARMLVSVRWVWLVALKIGLGVGATRTPTHEPPWVRRKTFGHARQRLDLLCRYACRTNGPAEQRKPTVVSVTQTKALKNLVYIFSPIVRQKSYSLHAVGSGTFVDFVIVQVLI